MNTCRVNLLPDDPAREDLFGPHQRVARAIAGTVMANRGGKAIALEGTWGSGKSTTVQLLAEELRRSSSQSEEPSSVFVFDVWAHRGDPLRRSFIEELADHLDQIDWIQKEEDGKDDDWDARLQELARRLERSRVKSSPGLTGLGQILIILIALVPIGLGLFASENIPIGWQIFGGFLAGGPALFALGVLLWDRSRGAEEAEGRDSDRFEWEEPSGAVLGVFINEVQKRTESTRIRTPDPTSIEFRSIFSDLLHDAIGKSNRRLVLAIDNLDRVDSEEALTIWSTMRTFFEFGPHRSQEWLERFWLLVPYDRDSLRHLWQRQLEDELETETQENLWSASDPAKAFIDKSFQVRFRVSPPVLSDWRHFFADHFEKALPDHDDEDERYKIFQIYSQSRDREVSGGITPRNIVLFLNQLGALHRQWEHEIPLEVQALFAAFRDQITPENIVSLEFVPNRLRRLLDKLALNRYLAALYFNVEPQKAVQVLMGGDVETGLSEGRSEILDDYQAVPGFSDVLNDRLGSNLPTWTQSEPNAIPRAAMVVADLVEGIRPPVRRDLWKSLREEVQKIESWEPFDGRAAEGLLKILQHTPVSSDQVLLADKILAAVSRGCPGVGEAGEEPTSLDLWAEGTVRLLQGLTKIEGESKKFELSVPIGAGTYLELLSHLRDHNAPADTKRRIVPEATATDIVEELVKRVEESEIDDAVVSHIRFLNTLERSWEWEPLGSATALALRADNALEQTSLPAMVQLFEQLTKLGSVPGEHVQQQVGQGHLHHRLHQANQTGSPGTIAACVLPILIHNPSGDLDSSPGNAANGQKLYVSFRDQPEEHQHVISELTDLVTDFGYAGILLTEEKYRGEAKALWQRLLAQIVKTEAVVDVIPTELVIDHIDLFREQILSEEDYDQLLKRYASESDLHDVLLDHSVSPDKGRLHLDVYDATRTQSRSGAFLKHLVDGLRDLPESTWITQLESEGPLLLLLTELIDDGIAVDLGTEFSDALHQHLQSVVEGKMFPQRAEDWGGLMAVLEPHTQEVVLHKAVRVLTHPGSGHKHRGVALYGTALLEHEAPLLAGASDVLITLVPDLLEERDLSGLAWIERLLDDRSDVLEKASSSARRHLEDKVRDESREVDPGTDVYLSISRIRERLGIEAENGRQDEDPEGQVENGKPDDEDG